MIPGGTLALAAIVRRMDARWSHLCGGVADCSWCSAGVRSEFRDWLLDAALTGGMRALADAGELPMLLRRHAG